MKHNWFHIHMGDNGINILSDDDYDYDNDDNTAKKGCLAAFLLLIILPLLLVPIGVYIWTFIKIIPLCPTAGIINLFLALLFFLLK